MHEDIHLADSRSKRLRYYNFQLALGNEILENLETNFSKISFILLSVYSLILVFNNMLKLSEFCQMAGFNNTEVDILFITINQAT